MASAFASGYYRLAVAQIELKEYEEALKTIRAGLQKQPGPLLVTTVHVCGPS
jgi:hypothetical protein